MIPQPRKVVSSAGPGAPTYAPPVVEWDTSLAPEHYRLVTAAPRPSIVAGDEAGLAHAHTTLAQLADETGDVLPSLEIDDSPRFSWRGAMLDVVRHFFPVEDVLAYIDDIAELKLNRLHLHLTDDQGWRIQIDSWPRLTEVGASTQVGGGGGGFYSKDDYRRIVEHAASRNVVVIPEIDMPGHTNAALVAYPELATEGVTPQEYDGIEVGFSTLDAHNEATYRFVEDVVAEVCAMTPGPWLHLGGDESLSTSEEDFLLFIARATEIASKYGKTLIGWHEMGRSRDLPAGTIGQYWNFTTPEAHHGEHLLGFVEQGGTVILSPADVAYLDIRYTEDHPLGLVWAKGPTSLQVAYDWEPSMIVPGLQESDILGIEAPLFTETITTLDELRSMAFPRLAALAEIMWSPKPEGRRSVQQIAPRLAAQARRWDRRGVRYERVDGVDWPRDSKAE